MGGPMNYARFVNRNVLGNWGYRAKLGDPTSLVESKVSRYTIEGELRRMEEDQLADSASYASQAGVTPEQAAVVLRAFLGYPEPDCERCTNGFSVTHGKEVNLGRCGEHVVWGRSTPLQGSD